MAFAYDSIASGNKGKGYLTQLNDPAGNSKFVYDVRGNVLSETRTIGTVAYAVQYSYDGADRLTSMTYPSGRIITYVRNASGKIAGVTSKANATAAALTLASNVAWQPNVAGSVSGETVFGQGGIATATQNMALPGSGGLGEVDLLQSLTYGNGLVLFKNFTTDNELFQLIVEQTPSTPAGIRINRFYNRADETNITGIADGQTPANDETYSYTDAGRLAGATSSTTASYGTRAWTYDGNGNRTSETANGVLQNYYYAANNNRLSNIAQGSVSKRIFTYDAAGNVTQDLKNSVTAYNYAINNAGRIRTLSIGTTLKTTYTYDGFQRLRIKAQTAPVSTTHYIWDSFGHIIAEHASAGGVQKEYIWLGDTPLAVFEGANLFYVHPDNLDRPVMMTNNNIGQTIAWQARYDPFGNAVTVTSAITNNQRLPGQWFQIEDGLAYNWHRTYDPTIGRYTQADPLGFVDGPSVYGYAGQRPLIYSDPTGEFIPIMIGIGGGLLFEYLTNGDCATWQDYAIAGGLGAFGGGAAIKGIKAFKYLNGNRKAKNLHPKLANKWENHHNAPKYLGGPKNGPLTELNGAYHQRITNEFRRLEPYGKNIVRNRPVEDVMKDVYRKYPLSWW